MSFTASDIKWVKNVNNGEGTAYMDRKVGETFELSFSDKHKTNAQSIKVSELILLFQPIKGKTHFTHIVEVVCHKLIEREEKPYPNRRMVKTVAFHSEGVLREALPYWKDVRLRGAVHGNACQLANIKAAKGISKELQEEVWEALRL